MRRILRAIAQSLFVGGLIALAAIALVTLTLI